MNETFNLEYTKNYEKRFPQQVSNNTKNKGAGFLNQYVHKSRHLMAQEPQNSLEWTGSSSGLQHVPQAASRGLC